MKNLRIIIVSILVAFSLGVFITYFVKKFNPFEPVSSVMIKPDTYPKEQRSDKSLSTSENNSIKSKSISNPISYSNAGLVKGTVEALSKIEVESWDTHFPDQAKPLFTTLKHQLRDLILTKLKSESSTLQDPKSIETKIILELEQEGIKIGNPWTDNTEDLYGKYLYGSIYQINIEQPKQHPELIVATTSLGVCCGEDTSFYLFRKKDSTWELIMEQEANDYDDVDGAHGQFSYAISSANKQNDFFVVTANVNPWCTSNWQSLRYTVLREGSWPSHPQIILNASESIYLGNYLGDGDLAYKLDVKSNSFTLTFEGDASLEDIDDGIVSRLHTTKFKINGLEASRIP